MLILDVGTSKENAKLSLLNSNAPPEESACLHIIEAGTVTINRDYSLRSESHKHLMHESSSITCSQAFTPPGQAMSIMASYCCENAPYQGSKAHDTDGILQNHLCAKHPDAPSQVCWVPNISARCKLAGGTKGGSGGTKDSLWQCTAVDVQNAAAACQSYTNSNGERSVIHNRQHL